MDPWNPEIVVIGAACLDIKGHVAGRIHPATSNPGRVRITVGGVARNVAENLARLGLRTALLTVVARDSFGHQVVKHTGRAGVDVSQVLFLRDQRTASYVALVDGEGNLSAAVDDTAILSELTPRYVYDRRRLFRQARMVVVDANTPRPAVETAMRLAQKYKVPFCLDPVSLELARRHRDHLEHIYLLTAGVVEAEALTGLTISSPRKAADAARQLVSAGVEVVVISLGRQGVAYASREQNGYVPAMRAEVVDPTGAADAQTAAIIYGLVNHFPLDEAVWLGASAAALTAQSLETVRSDLCLELLYQRLVS